MQFLGVHPGLTHRLLVAVVRAFHEGDLLSDWTDLAERVDISASPRAINRALSHLAEDGLIEGVYTSSGWMHLHATARGVHRAGRAARRPPKQRAATPVQALDAVPAWDEPRPGTPVSPAMEQSVISHTESEGSPAKGGMTAGPATRLSTALSLRMLAIRGQLLQALNVFKTLP